jgi:uncharacterized membrane protein
MSVSEGEVALPRNRLEAFTDAVIAIAITIMVLELAVPHETGLEALGPLAPVFGAYLLSFVNLGIYWNNHHHMMCLVDGVNGKILWSNLHLLFWLSLFPFATGWMGENGFAPVPTAAYGVVSLCAALAYYLLQSSIIASQGPGSRLAAAVGNDTKGKLSPVLYVAGIAACLVNNWLALGFYVVVALMWLVPDRRIESTLDSAPAERSG